MPDPDDTRPHHAPTSTPSSNGTAPTGHLDNPGAEKALLGAAFLATFARDVVATGTKPEDFYTPAHRQIAAVVTELASFGAPAEPLLVAEELHMTYGWDLDEAKRFCVDLQGDAPGTTSAAHYAQIVVGRAGRRRQANATEEVARALREGRDPTAALAAFDQARTASAARVNGTRVAQGGAFILDAPTEAPAVWGEGQDVLWAQGEPFFIVGPPGVGKSTLAGQMVRGRLGLVDQVIGYPVAPDRSGVLYLAMDRPAQLRRSLRRQFTDDDRATLDDRLTVWEGPPPRDLARHPGELVTMAKREGRGTVVLDSLKDAAIGLADDEVGAGLNRAVQECVAAGIEVLGLHHQRKGQAGARPRTLEDVYGSTWITAGAGSVVLLWGAAGDPIVELIHLKQPAGEVGPMKIEHHATTGTVSVFRGFDVLRYLQMRGTAGATTLDVAKTMTEKQKPTENDRKKAQRRLDQLVTKGHATTSEVLLGGEGGSSARRYRAKDVPT